RMGTVVIDRPKTNVSVSPGSVDFEGSHKDERGAYWLIGVWGDQYWPKVKVTLKINGEWKEKVGVGTNPGPRESIIGLFWVSDFMDDMLRDIRSRCDQLQKW